jgi:hypothetical protein
MREMGNDPGLLMNLDYDLEGDGPKHLFYFILISNLLSFAERSLCRTLLANSKGPQCPCASLSSRVP